MNISLLLLLLLLVTSTIAIKTVEKEVQEQDSLEDDWAVECDASHFDLVGKYTLGKQDELNRTFTHLQENIKQIGNVTFNTSGVSYFIYNTKPTFFYRDSKQQANILGNDTIVIYGGRVEVDVTFNWSKTTSVITRNGSGTAAGLSDMISFAKQITVENGSSYSYELLDWDNVTWEEDSGQPFHLKRVDPPDATDDDKKYLKEMFNNIMGIKTIRNQL